MVRGPQDQIRKNILTHDMFSKGYIILLIFLTWGEVKARLTFCAANADPDSRALIFFLRS